MENGRWRMAGAKRLGVRQPSAAFRRGGDIARRGGKLSRQHRNEYASQLHMLVRRGEGRSDLVDRLMNRFMGQRWYNLKVRMAERRAEKTLQQEEMA